MAKGGRMTGGAKGGKLAGKPPSNAGFKPMVPKSQPPIGDTGMSVKGPSMATTPPPAGLMAGRRPTPMPKKGKATGVPPNFRRAS
jgi:hypothetical protein